MAERSLNGEESIQTGDAQIELPTPEEIAQINEKLQSNKGDETND